MVKVRWGPWVMGRSKNRRWEFSLLELLIFPKERVLALDGERRYLREGENWEIRLGRARRLPEGGREN